MKRPMNLGFLASGQGSNLQAVIDACKTGRLKARVSVVISNDSQSGALTRARREGISHYHLSSKQYPDAPELDQAICDVLQRHEVTLVVLAGYMKKVGSQTLSHFVGRIINIHPSLLPKFGGQGMYGQRVHEAVLAAGEKETGVTIHFVDESYDTGPIIVQSRIPVRTDDTAKSLAQRVLEQEHRLLVDTLAQMVPETE